MGRCPGSCDNARDRLPASLDILLSHAPLTESNSVSAEEWRREYNITSLKQHYYVKETVDLIYKLIPDMERLAFYFRRSVYQ